MPLQDAQLAADRALARSLPRAWPAFFERFGRLTAVQRDVISHILSGADLLVCAATASGKTEAACAPLVERNIDCRAPWTILYISPTRALVNDLYARLEGPLGSLGLRLGAKTGDHRRGLNPSPNVLLTTPESFDSLLCRGLNGRSGGVHALANVTAVVLDEVHLLHGTARGEQIRYLLYRLRELRRTAVSKGWARDAVVQVIGLSATVPDPDAVLSAYMHDGVLVTLAGGRGIECVQPLSNDPSPERALPAWLQETTAPQKVLVFSNSRARVDELTRYLRQALASYRYEVYGHHGSLGKELREEAERAVKTRPRVVVCATSTLEIGIDIGDIDLVVLDGPAPSIPALLQRIGRGNRRTDTTRVMACSTSVVEGLVHSAMIEAARDSWLGPAERGPQHAVGRQQVISYIAQATTRARPQVRVERLLRACASPIVAAGLLPSMLEHEDLREDVQGLSLSDHWLKAFDIGHMHSNIDERPGITVHDEKTGAAIAVKVDAAFGKGMSIGGRLLEVRRWTDFKIEVRETTDRSLAEGGKKYVDQLWMKGSGQPQAVRRYLGIAENEWPVLQTGAGSFVFHFGGARRQAVLRLIASLAASPGSVAALNEWFFRLRDGSPVKPAWLTAVGSAMLNIAITQELPGLERTLARPRTNKLLPQDMRIDEVRGWLQVERELERIASARWVIVHDADVAAALQLLLDSATN